MIEIRTTFLGVIPFSGWQSLDKKNLLDSEEISEAVLLKKPKIIESIEVVGGMLVVRGITFDQMKSGYQSRTLTFDQSEIPLLNKYLKVGIVSNQVRSK